VCPVKPTVRRITSCNNMSGSDSPGTVLAALGAPGCVVTLPWFYNTYIFVSFESSAQRRAQAHPCVHGCTATTSVKSWGKSAPNFRTSVSSAPPPRKPPVCISHPPGPLRSPSPSSPLASVLSSLMGRARHAPPCNPAQPEHYCLSGRNTLPLLSRTGLPRDMCGSTPATRPSAPIRSSAVFRSSKAPTGRADAPAKGCPQQHATDGGSQSARPRGPGPPSGSDLNCC
jgi:hypothetical protein